MTYYIGNIYSNEITDDLERQFVGTYSAVQNPLFIYN